MQNITPGSIGDTVTACQYRFRVEVDQVLLLLAQLELQIFQPVCHCALQSCGQFLLMPDAGLDIGLCRVYASSGFSDSPYADFKLPVPGILQTAT